MRLKFLLTAKDTNKISYNYHYPLSSAIYKLLQFGSPEFSEFLHGNGFRINGKTYKLFTFSLKFEDFSLNPHGIYLKSPRATLLVSSPLLENFIKFFILGTLKDGSFSIGDATFKAMFKIRDVIIEPEPEFTNRVKFRPLSPLVVSVHTIRNEKKTQHFLLHDENPVEFARIFNKNLANKYELITGEVYAGDPLRFEWDNGYIKSRLANGKKVTKKITVKKEAEPPIDVIGNEIPFYLEGDKRLIALGYNCGFGEKNSAGFGMTEVIEIF